MDNLILLADKLERLEQNYIQQGKTIREMRRSIVYKHEQDMKLYDAAADPTPEDLRDFTLVRYPQTRLMTAFYDAKVQIDGRKIQLTKTQKNNLKRAHLAGLIKLEDRVFNFYLGDEIKATLPASSILPTQEEPNLENWQDRWAIFYVSFIAWLEALEENKALWYKQE
jgi:hypothetical protein